MDNRREVGDTLVCYCCIQHNAVQRAALRSVEVLFNTETNHSQVLKSKISHRKSA